MGALFALAQAPQSGDSASVHGTVRDVHGRAVSQAQVQLQARDSKQVLSAITDAQGVYSFSNLQQAVYVLRVVAANGRAEIPSIALGAKESKTVDVILGSGASSAQTAPQFYDEPQFTVSGVTDTTNLGGHGSDSVVRTRELLAKETATLAHPEKGGSASASATEKSLRAELDHSPGSFEANYRLGLLLLENNRADEAIADLRHAAEIEPGDAAAHHALGDVGEKLHDPLAAVHEYQRAAEINRSETYLFDWGAELLLHHAPEPAIEVFTKGNSLYPRSTRMLIGLGAAWFARGASEQAVERICEASDLNAPDVPPYLFLGKMLRAENRPSRDMIEKLQRFYKLYPENPEANYYYAVALWKTRKDAKDPAVSQAELLLKRTIQLNPKFAAAELQLGIVHAEQGDSAKAISDFHQAVNLDPQMEEAHYRLGQAYRQAGEAEKSKEELRIYQKLAAKSAQEIERERHEIRQFVYTLRDQPRQTH